MNLNLFAAQASKMAYPEYEPLSHKKYLIENKKTDTQCYVYKHDGITVVAFRGTEKKLRDILTDLWAFKKKIPFNNTKGIRVHRGFLRSYLSVRDLILDKVLSLGYDKILVCGHSLGGALATLCAVDIQKNDIYDSKYIYVKTFGSPKVGNRKFRDSYNKRIINHNRFQNRLDIVPTVPVFASHVGNKTKLKPKIRHDIDNYIYNITFM